MGLNEVELSRSVRGENKFQRDLKVLFIGLVILTVFFYWLLGIMKRYPRTFSEVVSWELLVTFCKAPTMVF